MAHRRDELVLIARRLADTARRHSFRQAEARLRNRLLLRTYLRPLRAVSQDRFSGPPATPTHLPVADPLALARIRAAAGSGTLPHPWSAGPDPCACSADIQERHNHQRFRLTARAQARDWLMTGDARSLDRLQARIRGWLEGRDDHMDLAMSPLNISLRIREWLWLLMLASGDAALPATLRSAMIDSLRQQAWRLARMIEHEAPGNHPLVNLASLWSLAALVPGTVSPRRRALLARDLEREVVRSFLPDGFHVELATHYHVQALRVLEECLIIAEAVGEPLGAELGRCVARARRAQRLVTPRDGLLPLLGDSCFSFYDEESTADLATLFSLHPDEYGSPWHVSFPATESTLWLRAIVPAPGPGTEEDARASPPLDCHHFPDAGYLVAHWERSTRAGYFLFDAGPLGYRPNPGHGHADLLNIVLHLEGTPLLVDPGTARYDNDPASLWFKRARAHNTLALDDGEPADLWRFFRWCSLPPRPTLRWSYLPGGMEAEGCSRAYERSHGITHVRRCFLRCADELTVIDDVFSATACPQPISISYHLDPQWKLQAAGEADWLVSRAGRNVRFHVQGSEPVAGRACQEAVAPRYGQAVPAPVLRLSAQPRGGSTRIVTTLRW